MNIIKYEDYFHDGYVNGINHLGNNIDFFLESSVINPNEIADKDLLTPSNTFKGTLTIYNIKNFKINNKKYEGVLKMQYDDGDILELKIAGNRVFLLIQWKDFPPKTCLTDVSKIEIEAQMIQWIPDEFHS